jgi:hypothetical protein
MTNVKPRLAASNPAARSPERAALAEDIARRDDIERKLATAKDATEQARAKRWAAEERLEALQKQKAEASAAQSLGAKFLASVEAGQPCGVDVLERPGTTREEDALEREIELWAETQAECAASIPALESAVNFAAFRVDESAREAIKASPAVAEILDGLDQLHSELDKRLSALAYLRRRNMISDSDMDAALAAIRRPVLLGDHHLICDEWTAAFKSLARSADYPIPKIGE